MSSIDVIGTIWMPAVTGAISYPLSDYDVAHMDAETDAQGISRSDILSWLYKNAGDFQSIQDFRATINGAEYGWADEESELTYNDCMWPEEE